MVPQDSATMKTPNLVPVQRALREGEPPIPDHIRSQEHTELGSDVTVEWVPLTPFEELEGVLIRKQPMQLGGTLYVFATKSEEDTEHGQDESVLVLLKRGGVIFDSHMAGVEAGERVWIRYCGELPAKPGKNPARDWRIVKLFE